MDDIEMQYSDCENYVLDLQKRQPCSMITEKGTKISKSEGTSLLANNLKNKKLFPQKLWNLINDEKYNFCLRWSDDGQLVYLNRDEFENSYLKTAENQFHTQKAISFVRQMNMYGFKKVDDCYYENDNFKRNCDHLLKNMIRKHPNKNNNQFEATPIVVDDDTHINDDPEVPINSNLFNNPEDLIKALVAQQHFQLQQQRLREQEQELLQQQSSYLQQQKQQQHELQLFLQQQQQQPYEQQQIQQEQPAIPRPETETRTSEAEGASLLTNNSKNKKLFPQKLWDLINDEKYNFCLRWSDDGQLVYLNRDEFENFYLKTAENQFHTQKAISFVRQMNMYGFKKVDDCYYENDNFKRNCDHLLKNMIRKHPNKNNNHSEANSFVIDDNTNSNEATDVPLSLHPFNNPEELIKILVMQQRHQLQQQQQLCEQELLQPQTYLPLRFTCSLSEILNRLYS